MNLPDRAVLDNGAVLVSQAFPSNPFIAFRGCVPAGVVAEDDRRGVAEFMARLMLGGTRRMPAAKIADRLESMGATLDFHNSEEALGFSGRCTRSTLGETMRLLAECLSQPAFPPKEVERVRRELLNDLRIEQDDPRHRAERDLAVAIYSKDHPYGRDPKGDHARIKRIRRTDVAAFHEAVVGSEGLILAIVGDVDRPLLEGSVEPALSRISGDARRREVPPVPAYRPRTRTIPMPHKSQADIAVGGPAVPRRHEDYYALYLGNLLFGRIGLYGRLGRNLRDEQGLAYYASSSVEAHLAGGMWSIAAGVNPSNLERALGGIRDEMDRLRTAPFTEDEVADGRDNQLGSLVVSLERNGELASELFRMEYFGLGMDFLERYPEIVAGLTPQAVRAAAVRYLDPAGSSLVVAGPVGRARVSL